jgi:transcription antitermination factor NusG
MNASGSNGAPPSGREGGPAGPAPKWHVLHLRPRCEKKAAEHCAALGLPHRLPLRRETKVYQRRRVTVSKPVFPGYVFVAFGREGRLELLKTNQVVRILIPADDAGLLRDLDQVEKALAVDPTLGACASLGAGRRVRITGGPFLGVEGIVSAVRGQAKVMLNVEIIGQAVAVEVGPEYLEPAD